MNDKIVGIYCIQNMINEKRYIGSSANIYQRFNQHRSALKRSNHVNNYLQNAWNKYGEDNFSFYIIEIVDDFDNLISKEDYYINFYKSYSFDSGYNIAPPVKNNTWESPYNFYVMHLSTLGLGIDDFNNIINLLCNTALSLPEISKITGVSKRIISNIYQRKAYKPLTEGLSFKPRSGVHSKITEEQANIIIKLLLEGKSIKQIRDIVEFDVSIYIIEDIRRKKCWERLTENIIFPPQKKRGKPSGVKTRKRVGKYSMDGVFLGEYPSLKSAGEENNISWQYISDVCNGRHKSTYGYIWKFL